MSIKRLRRNRWAVFCSRVSQSLLVVLLLSSCLSLGWSGEKFSRQTHVALEALWAPAFNDVDGWTATPVEEHLVIGVGDGLGLLGVFRSNREAEDYFGRPCEVIDGQGVDVGPKVERVHRPEAVRVVESVFESEPRCPFVVLGTSDRGLVVYRNKMAKGVIGRALRAHRYENDMSVEEMIASLRAQEQRKTSETLAGLLELIDE